MYGEHAMTTFAPTLAKRLKPHTPFVTQLSFPGGAMPQRAITSRMLRKLAATFAGTGVDYTYGTLFRDSDRIVALCEAHRQRFVEVSPIVEAKSVIIPPPPFLQMAPENNGDHRARANSQFQIGASDFLIEYFGYIYPTKGVETLLRAFHIVAQRRSNLRLLIAGGTPDEKSHRGVTQYAVDLRNVVNELGIGDRVAWSGPYPWDSDIGSSYLRAADLCVLPFDRGVLLNNSSFSAAASHGLPIISTRAELTEPVFVHEENVLLCPPQDPAALASAIERVVDDPHLRQRLRDGVRQMAKEWYSWESVIKRTLAALTPESGKKFQGTE
jgi:glycosyltransferase involved in cell wall biosynthesis